MHWFNIREQIYCHSIDTNNQSYSQSEFLNECIQSAIDWNSRPIS